jgi:Icc protein
MLLAHVSDTHLLCDATASLWDHIPAASLASVMNTLPPADAIIATGDIADDGTAAAYTLADVLTASHAPRRYLIAGNHDDRTAMASVFGAAEDWQLVDLSRRWALGLLNTQWVGHEAGRVSDRTLEMLRRDLAHVEHEVVLCLHHPPLSPCPHTDCGLIAGDALLQVLRGSPVRVVLSGHVHQAFEKQYERITFLGAPSTFRQLRHGGDPHYVDTGEPPGARLVELGEDGSIEHRIVLASD